MRKLFKFTVLLTRAIYEQAKKDLLWKYVTFKDYTYGLTDESIVAIQTDNTQLVLDLAEMVEESHKKEAK